MYESEANCCFAPSSEVPPDVLARFLESRKTVTERTLIPWGEHCTECSWPTCYATCELYEPRLDGRCRRFVEGMVRINAPGGLNSYLLKIGFRRWAKLWSPANLKMCSLPAAERAERLDRLAAACIRAIPIAPLRHFVSLKRYSMKKRRVMRDVCSAKRPDFLLIECFSPNTSDVPMTVVLRSERSRITFQMLLAMRPGFNRHRIELCRIAAVVDLEGQFQIELAPNDNPEGLTLYFGAMDFVVEPGLAGAAVAAQAKLCKCVVWDLDNTLWDGTLIEDGPARLRLKAGVVDVLKGLNDRGILLSVASKNNREDALAVLRHFGIEDYFLFPQISWNPKGQALRQIATSLNIGIESLLFVDDSPFEREEVRSACPGVLVVDAAESSRILDRPECQTPVTEESRKRRLLYRDQQRREEAQRDFRGEYEAFLRDCQLRLTVRPIGEANIERVYELTQRTNQMNFSGNRYSRSQLLDLLKSGDTDTFVLDCQDRFGRYGTVGFCVVSRPDARMTDLMFSCRVQGKRVEHAFLSHLINKYRQMSACEFCVSYRKTAKNAESARVFDDLGFQKRGEVDGISQLAFPPDIEVPCDGIVAIEDETVPTLSRLA